MDHDAVADSRLPVLIRAGGEAALCVSPPVIGPFLKHQEKTMSAAHRIDVHQHVVPPFWAKALPTHGGDPSGTVIPACRCRRWGSSLLPNRSLGCQSSRQQQREPMCCCAGLD